MTPTPPPTPALDFAAIRSRCPRAFAALIGPRREWAAKVNPPGHPFHEYFRDMDDLQYVPRTPRDLFDFFDEQGVYVSVWHKQLSFQTTTYTGIVTYAFSLANRGAQELDHYPTRAAAEQAAFTAGFEKLEEMLNQEEG